MKQKILILTVLFIALSAICKNQVLAQNNKSYNTLTLQKVNFNVSGSLNVSGKSLSFTDEKGVEIIVADLGELFENVKVKNIVFPEGAIAITAEKVGDNFGFVAKLADNAKMECDFEIESKVYAVSLGEGTEFFTEKTSGEKYILLLEETAKLPSPPSITEKK